MSARRRVGVRSSTRRRSAGQSIPLIGLMIVILVAMVGLSVDVGNTFSQERRAVLAANTASLSGMNEVLKGSLTDNRTIRSVIQQSLAANGINAVPLGTTPGPGQINWEAYYLDRDGAPLEGTPTIPDNGNDPPADVAFVQVSLSGEVDTYFARVVGRPDLPVRASSYAGVCPANVAEVYPIGVNVDLLNLTTGEFRQPPAATEPGNGNTFDYQWQRITDPLSLYPNKTKMRISLHSKFPGSTGTGGNFGFLNWTGDPGSGSAPALTERLTLPGNLDKAYKEVPDGDLEGIVDPSTYPPAPSILSPGDYIWGDSGAPNNSISTALADHMQRGTQMILPIYDPNVVGTGNNSKFKVVALGTFVVLGYDIGGANGYIDMVYLGEPTSKLGACNVSSVPSNRYFELGGTVDFYPQYQSRSATRIPVRYVLVLDVSGSMAANFAGQCDRYDSNPTNPSPTQCTASTAADGVTLTNATRTGGQWSVESERRHIIAREAVKSLIDVSNMGPNYTEGAPGEAPAPDEMAMVRFNNNFSTSGDIATFRSSASGGNAKGSFRSMSSGSGSGRTAFSNNPDGLDDAIEAVYNNLPSGGTNGAAGLYGAFNLINNASPMRNSSGQPVDFRTVVIFVTDGVSNVFFHEQATNFEVTTNSGSDPNAFPRNTYPTDSTCTSYRRQGGNNIFDIPNLVESAPCQMNEAGFRNGATGVTRNVAGVNRTLSRPITQMGEVSTTYLKATAENGRPRAEVFVIALSGATRNGMGTVVSNSLDTNFVLVTEAGRLDDAFRDIYNRTSNVSCPVTEQPLQSTISAEQFIPVGSFVHPIVGEVSISGTTVTGETITDKKAPIRAGDGNRLYYLYTDVPAGQYTLTAKVYYRDPLDVSTAPREYSMFADDQPSAQVTVTATTATASLKARTDFPLVMWLNGVIDPNTCPS